MRARDRLELINTPEVEAWPGSLLRARRNAHARALARAEWILRRKRDGRYLAGIVGGRLRMLDGMPRDAAIELAFDAAGAATARAASRLDARPLPLHRLAERLAALGLDDGYATRTGLVLVAEPARLRCAGRDRFRRPLWLAPRAAAAWSRMRLAARDDGIALDAISGYRSHDYQLGIFERKLARGQSVEQILAVNAAPGFSEHHGGCALDIGTPGEPPAEQSFERTPAYDWLQRRAGEFGFVLSYPRGNPHGIVYEPWHWCWRG